MAERRSLFSRIFGSDKSTTSPPKSTEFKILDDNKAIFTTYKGDFENDPDIRACVDTIARNAAKMHPRHIRNYAGKLESLKGNLYKILAKQPNELQNAYKFYYQVVYSLELYNNSFIYVQKDSDLKITGLYPLNFNQCKLYEYEGKLWIEFQFGRSKKRFVPYADIIHLTRFVSEDGIFGGNTKPIVKALSIKHIMDEGIVNAIKTTQSIKGVIKSTQAMLKPEDVKKMRDQFVKDFIEESDNSGIGGLDATTTFDPVKIEPTTAAEYQVKEIDDKVLAYFGLSEEIIHSKYDENQWNAFYESVLEPIGLQMSLEFSNKLFTPTEKGFGNEILFESNALQYASNSTKISLLRYGNNIMMVDELREIFNMAPLPNGEGQVIMQDVNHNILNDQADTNEGGNENEGN